ncbi:MAG TPA: NAD(P)/FAD-dependent oxidoreductase [Gemmatimonadaceae bacterium]|nr:NAD(P)/FAD-dependent oxidoreductase [Gemmatimonadaceae bacterium]
MRPDTPPVLVIGAGIAGLIAALDLHRAGRAVQVLEAAPEPGGRVRTTVRDGVQLDHGFQVLFTGYPVLNTYLDHDALDLRAFRPAAHIVRDHGVHKLMGDAIADPSLLLPSLTGGAVPWRDLWRLLQLRTAATRLSVDECFAPRFAGVSTRDFLRAWGFSARTIDGFFAPFYGGILLDRSLATRASVLLFTFKMLSEGRTAVPAAGMGAIPRQLAAQLPAGTVMYDTLVRSITVRDGRASGVTLDDGRTLDASHVVLATDFVTARALAGTAGVTLDGPTTAVGCTTLTYLADRAVLPGRALYLNARRDATVSHAITMTEVAPTYAPAGRHLVSATVLGAAAEQPDDVLDRAVRSDLARMATESAPLALERVAVWRVPVSQFAQLPATAGDTPRPTARTPLAGLLRASEVLHSSSLEGAACGGQAAARAILDDGATGDA